MGVHALTKTFLFLAASAISVAATSRQQIEQWHEDVDAMPKEFELEVQPKDSTQPVPYMKCPLERPDCWAEEEHLGEVLGSDLVHCLYTNLDDGREYLKSENGRYIRAEDVVAADGTPWHEMMDLARAYECKVGVTVQYIYRWDPARSDLLEATGPPGRCNWLGSPPDAVKLTLDSTWLSLVDPMNLGDGSLYSRPDLAATSTCVAYDDEQCTTRSQDNFYTMEDDVWIDRSEARLKGGDVNYVQCW